MKILNNLISLNKISEENKKLKNKIKNLKSKNQVLNKKLHKFKTGSNKLKDNLLEKNYLLNIHFKNSKLYQKELTNILTDIIPKLVDEKMTKYNSEEIYKILYSLDREGLELIGTAYNLTGIDIDKEFPKKSNLGYFHNQSRKTILHYMEIVKFDDFGSSKYKEYKNNLYYLTVNNLLDSLKENHNSILHFNDDDKKIKLFLSDILLNLLSF